MSLVNEALRRADDEKRQRLAGVTPPGPPPAAEYRAPPPRRFRRLLILVCIVVSVAVAAAFGIRWVAGKVIQQATAAVNNLTEQGAAAVAAGATAELPAAVTVQHQTDQPPQIAATGEPRPSGATPSNPGEALPSSGSTLQIDPEVAKRIASSLVPPKGAAAGPGAGPKDEGEGEPAPAAKPQTNKKKHPLPAKADAKAASAKKDPPASPAPKPKPQTAEKKPPPAAPPVDTSHLKVSSIMLGPRGGTAIINGRPVGVGETVGGAKVIKITRRIVEVEINGRRATLRM